MWTNFSFSKGCRNPLSHLYSTLIYDNPNMSIDFAEVQQRLYSHTARIVEAMKSPRLQEGEREWIMCYDFSFLFLHRSSVDSLLLCIDFSPSFCGCLTPKPGFHYFTPRMACFFSLSSHGHPFYFMCNVLYSLLPSIAQTTYFLYSSWLFCHEHCLVRAPGLHVYIYDDTSCTFLLT